MGGPDEARPCGAEVRRQLYRSFFNDEAFQTVLQDRACSNLYRPRPSLNASFVSGPRLLRLRCAFVLASAR